MFFPFWGEGRSVFYIPKKIADRICDVEFYVYEKMQFFSPLLLLCSSPTFNKLSY